MQRLSSTEAADVGNAAAARVDPAVGGVVYEGKRITESPRVSMPPELAPVLESPTTAAVLESSEPSEPACTDSPPESGNSLQLDVTPTEAPELVMSHEPVDAIPALGLLVQLDSEFGANPSPSILCPAEEQLGAFRVFCFFLRLSPALTPVITRRGAWDCRKCGCHGRRGKHAASRAARGGAGLGIGASPPPGAHLACCSRILE